MADPVVSILIVTWKRIDLLEECLHGIAAAKPDVPFEIVIVNNGAARTAARVDAISAGARVVHSRVNLGLPGGLQLARSMARGKYLAVLQDDVVVQAGWLDRLVARMDQDPWVGIVGSSVEIPGGYRICGLYLLGGLTWLHPPADPKPVPVDLCTSASMLIRARAWDDAGGPSARAFSARVRRLRSLHTRSALRMDRRDAVHIAGPAQMAREHIACASSLHRRAQRATGARMARDLARRAARGSDAGGDASSAHRSRRSYPRQSSAARKGSEIVHAPRSRASRKHRAPGRDAAALREVPLHAPPR